MGLFDKLKKLVSNPDAGNIQGKFGSLNIENITKKATSATDSMTNKLESLDADEIANSIDSKAELMAEKIESVDPDAIVDNVASAAGRMTEKVASSFRKENDDDDDNYEDDYEDDEEYEDSDDEYESEEEDDDEVDEEDEARKKERNKKMAKGLAKGAMFVGSFLYAQREGADSGASLMHAFKKTKDVDDLFEGKKKDKKKKDKDQSNDKKIKSIAHYKYICPKNNRGHNIDVPDIDIPTADGSGCPTREEAIQAIKKATGVNDSTAHAIWNGGATSAWKKVSYTYVNDGKLGGTVKCN